jgi:hypothetical protein
LRDGEKSSRKRKYFLKNKKIMHIHTAFQGNEMNENTGT